MNKTFLQFVQEASDAHDQAMSHKAQADKAMDKNDLESYHMHMSAHHESMGQWHESKGRQGNADKEYEKAEKHHDLGVKKATQKNEEVELDEAGAFSYGAKPARKGSVAYNAMMKRKEQEKNQKPIEPKDQMVGTAKVVKEEEEEVELDEAASVSVTVQATAPADKKYAVTEIHPRTSPRGRTKWKDVSYHSSEQEAKTAADAHAKKNNLHRMKPIVAEELDEVNVMNRTSPARRADYVHSDKSKKPGEDTGTHNVVDAAGKVVASYKNKMDAISHSNKKDDYRVKSVYEEVELDESSIFYETNKPGWMLKRDPELAKKLKAKIDLAKKRQAAYGDKSAGKSVSEELDEADWGSYSKRQFKSREMEHELAHEVQPKRAASTDSPHAVHIDGKKWKTFSSKSHATNVANKIKNGKATVHKEEVELEEETDVSKLKAQMDKHFEKAVACNRQGDDAACKMHKAAADKIKSRIVKIQSQR